MEIGVFLWFSLTLMFLYLFVVVMSALSHFASPFHTGMRSPQILMTRWLTRT